MFQRTYLFVALGAFSIGLDSCCGAPIGKQVREEMALVRGSKIIMRGLIEMPEFTDPSVVAKLVAGSSEERIVELVGPAWRKLPATQGELWVWDMNVYQWHELLAINVVDGRQRGSALSESRTIPDFMLHHGSLKPGIETSRVVDCIGSPTRWEIGHSKTAMIWEATVNLEQDGRSWRYSPDTYLHSLLLEIVDDHLRSVCPRV